ncbi:uncharacterized protein LOC119615371, partial [Lucilia sericata]|uniref:uncharacterized protein LOC119615371 n=1 Tax=Lucilia sericata TaxID=13632 RepID=UPI0018A813F9
STSIPGYRFTNCYANRLQQLFWHVIISFSFMVVVVISLRFWNQFENQSTLPVYEMLAQGTKLPYPSVYVCLGYPLNPIRLANLKSNLTMSYKDIDKNLQNMLRFQRSTKNVKYNLTELFLYNVDITNLRKHFIKFYYQINELLKDCYVQGLRFDCADIFIPLELAPGFCFVFNSIYTQKNFHENPLKVPYKEFSEFDDDWTIRFKILYGNETALLMYLKDPRNLLSLTDYPNYVWRPRKQISEYGYTIVNQYSEEKNRKLNLGRHVCKECLSNCNRTTYVSKPEIQEP